MDDWDFLDEVDVMARWPAEQKKHIESPKWQERKESLECLLELIDANPRLSTASMTIYGEIMDQLKKIISKDSNVNVVILGLKIVTGISRGLRLKFAIFLSMIWPHVLEKSKDKKQNVRDAVGDALDAIAASVTDPERLSGELATHMQKPSPQSKQCLCLFLYRYFKTWTAPCIPFVKSVLPILVKLASDSDPSVRDAACSALGSAKRVLGDAINSFLGGLSSDKTKMDKIEEFLKTASAEWAEENARRPNASNGTGNGAGAAVEDGDAPSVAAAAGPADIDPWTLLDPVELDSQLPRNWHEMVTATKWQERKEAIEALQDLIPRSPRFKMTDSLRELINVLVKILEKDVNINVSSGSAKCLSSIAAGLRADFLPFVSKLVAVCCDKLKEKKAVLRTELNILCDSIANVAPLSLYTESLNGGMSSKNPQSRAQTCAFVANLLARHDQSTLPVNAIKELASSITKCCSDADAEVRDTALLSIAAVQKSVGESVCARLFSDVLTDKLKADKIPSLLTKLTEQYGTTATPEMRRLAASEPSSSENPSSSSTAAPNAPKPKPASSSSSRPVSSRPAPAAQRVRPSMGTAPRPAVVSARVAPPISSAAATRPSSARAPLTSGTAPRSSASSSAPSLARPASGVTPRVRPAPVSAKPVVPRVSTPLANRVLRPSVGESSRTASVVKATATPVRSTVPPRTAAGPGTPRPAARVPNVIRVVTGPGPAPVTRPAPSSSTRTRPVQPVAGSLSSRIARPSVAVPVVASTAVRTGMRPPSSRLSGATGLRLPSSRPSSRPASRIGSAPPSRDHSPSA